MKLNTKKTEGKKQGIKCCACYCHIQGILCEQCEYDVCDLDICQPTEKPMDTKTQSWELDLEEVFVGLWGERNEDGNFTIYQGNYPNITSTIKQYIKDLLKDSNAYQAGISAERVNNPHTYDIYTQSDMDFKIAEYKQKLIKRIRKMKKPYITKTSEELDVNVGFNKSLDEVEAVIKVL